MGWACPMYAHSEIYMYVYRRGSQLVVRPAPRNREIVSFRACMRHAVSGREDVSNCKNNARRLPLILCIQGGLPL